MPSLNPHNIETLQACFRRLGADEGTVWLLDKARECLVPVWNSGPNAAQFVGQYSQPLGEGLIGLVCVTEQAVCENGVYKNANQDPTLDRKLGLLTCSMLAVPLHRKGEVIGVVSCVRLKAADVSVADPLPFSAEDIGLLVETVRTIFWEVRSPS